MVANMNEVLKPVQQGKYPVGLFNAVNLELARGIIATAVEAIKQEAIKKLELFDSTGKSPYSKYNVDKIVKVVVKKLAAKQIF